MTSRRAILVLLVFTVFFFAFAQSLCSDWKSCKTCTERKSWKGDKCQWCPIDSTCHLPASTLNNCSAVQNIKEPKEWSVFKSNYEPNLAHKMAMLSAVAYSPNASAYIDSALPCDTFTNITQVATPCPGKVGNCSGFTAVSHDTKEIIVAFSGSQNKSQVTEQVIFEYAKPGASFISGSKVQAHFKKDYDAVWPLLKPLVYSHIKENPSYKVRVTGHALGGALASMVSTDIAFDGNTSLTNIYLYTFGQPRVGNYGYARVHDQFVQLSWRVVHGKDPIVRTPPCWSVPFTGCRPSDLGPYHHGTEIFYKGSKMSSESKYKECLGLPHDEDKSCSNNPDISEQCVMNFTMCMADHKEYFGVPVGTWWETQDPLVIKSEGKVCITKMTNSPATSLTSNTIVHGLILQLTIIVATLI